MSRVSPRPSIFVPSVDGIEARADNVVVSRSASNPEEDAAMSMRTRSIALGVVLVVGFSTLAEDAENRVHRNCSRIVGGLDLAILQQQ